jgi:hypothetical protein
MGVCHNCKNGSTPADLWTDTLVDRGEEDTLDRKYWHGYQDQPENSQEDEDGVGEYA